MNTHRIGVQGENRAVEYLKKKGYKIIERNFHCHFGEIDIIAMNQGYVVFIEVKSRNSVAFGLPREAVTLSKQKTIIACANYWLSSNIMVGKPVRFDVVEILDGKVDVIKDAFRI